MAPRRCVTPSPARSSRCPNSFSGRGLGIKELRWPSTPASRSRRACESISAILTAHGNGAPTRTLTDCCISTSPKGPISACTAPTRLQPWPPPSTRCPERHLIGRHPQRRLTGFSYQPTHIVLRRPLESAQYTSEQFQRLMADNRTDQPKGLPYTRRRQGRR